MAISGMFFECERGRHLPRWHYTCLGIWLALLMMVGSRSAGARVCYDIYAAQQYLQS